MKTDAGLLAPVSPAHGFQADSSRQRICCVRRDQAEPGTRSLRLEGSVEARPTDCHRLSWVVLDFVSECQ